MRRLTALLLCLLLLAGLAPCAGAEDRIAAVHTEDNGCPYYLMVNRRQNTVTVYAVGEDGRYSRPVKAMICSTGRTGHATPTGTFTLTGLNRRWCYMVDGTYGQYSCQFYGNYLFHSICYTAPRGDRLITREYNALGGVASLGCVRLQTEDAKWIYDNCRAGTLVTVYDGDSPGALGKPTLAVAEITPETDNGWDPTDPDEANPWRATRVTALALDSTAAELPVGETLNLTCTLTPAEAVWPALTWQSDAPDTASVDANGRVTALRAGTAVITAACGSVTAACTVTVTGEALPYADVPLGAWYYGTVRQVTDLGLLVGTGETEFSPTAPVSRAMLAQILYRLAGEPTAYYVPWQDMEREHWAWRAACWAHSTGVLPGAEGQFAPEEPISRQEAVAALWRLAGSPEAEGTLEGFADREQAAEDCVPALTWAVSVGLVTGTDTGCLLPGDSLTRAQFSALLLRRMALTGEAESK